MNETKNLFVVFNVKQLKKCKYETNNDHVEHSKQIKDVQFKSSNEYFT